MSLEMPDKVRNLQRKLYCKAKADPAFRFYLLCDKICREDILRHAYALARANAGAPGVEGVTFVKIDAFGVDVWLAGVREERVSKTYWPASVRRVTIPKPGGGERPLGISTIRDRAVQTAAKIVLEPILRRTSRTAPMAIDTAAARSMRSRKRTGCFAGATPTLSTSICRNIRHDSALGPPQIGGPTHRRRAVAGQAMAESASRTAEWRRKAAHEWQDESQRSADAGQQERVAEGANSTEPPLGRLGCLLLPWRSRIGVSGR